MGVISESRQARGMPQPAAMKDPIYFDENRRPVPLAMPDEPEPRLEERLAAVIDAAGVELAAHPQLVEALLEEMDEYCDVRSFQIAAHLMADWADRLEGTAAGEGLRRVIRG